MRNLIIAFVAALLLASCANKEDQTAKSEVKEEVTTEADSQEQSNTFGVTVQETNAVSVTDLVGMLSEKDLAEDVVVKGKVKEVCKKKGCWMTLEKEDGETMRVTFKDYALFMPFDIPGKEVVIHGKAEKKVTPVDELKHYAEDEGKSTEEIAAITEDEIAVAFEADGVLIK